MNHVQINITKLGSLGEVLAVVECKCGGTGAEFSVVPHRFGLIKRKACKCGIHYGATMGGRGLTVFRNLIRSPKVEPGDICQVHFSAKSLVFSDEVKARVECGCGDKLTVLSIKIGSFGITDQALCTCGAHYKAMMGAESLSLFRDLSRNLSL